MQVDSKTNPFTNFNFRVKFERLELSGFCYVGGFESQLENDLAGNQSACPCYRNVVLKRGFDGKKDLWHWYRAGEKDRRNGEIEILDAGGAVVSKIEISQAWLCRWSMSELDAIHAAVLTEEIELVVESFQVN